MTLTLERPEVSAKKISNDGVSLDTAFAEHPLLEMCASLAKDELAADWKSAELKPYDPKVQVSYTAEELERNKVMAYTDKPYYTSAFTTGSGNQGDPDNNDTGHNYD